ncbi:hypothetical protein [Spelaeicoccus albus]|uniref:Uncharacterized protein n=1 Tax=Spelaeicoccus albus TaxID=1280376 RepID=A0A7Z0ABA1_9MICO|nr:hypothetical protein [Spelaeicoccus albus]NYI67021.1 hypothetical protein [Spelaeicoccus albus]
MDYLASDNWWLTTGLQGVIGSIVGVLGTVGVLLATLWVQSKRIEETDVQNETQRVLGESNEFGRMLLPAAAGRGASEVEIVTKCMELSQDVGFLSIRARRTDPHFADFLALMQDWVSRGVFGDQKISSSKINKQECINATANLKQHLKTKLSEPNVYRRCNKRERDRALSGVHQLMDITAEKSQ